jgi:uncharacterized protein YkwD
MSSVSRGVVAIGVVATTALLLLDPVGSWAAPNSSSPPLVAHVAEPAQRGGSIVVPIDTTIPPSVPRPDDGAEVVARANAARSAAGLAPLAIQPALVSAAQAHSHDQASTGRMTHVGSDGSDAGTRIVRAGFTPRTWGENVAMGYRTATAVFDGWMSSPGHRANILHDGFTLVGVAVAYATDGTPYWTMVLAA